MKKLAIIGASYLQEPLVRKAKEMGLEVHCFAWEEGAVCKDIADYFYPISIVEKEQILKKCQEIGIDGITTIASDVAAPTVAYIANKMGLIGNDYDAAVRANNKYLMRNAFIKAGVPCPKYIMFSESDVPSSEILDKLRDVQLPLIVKPSDRSGSLGVTKVETPSDFFPAIEKTTSLTPPRPVIFELIISVFQPFLSAYLQYILNNSPAKSAASSPPAPPLISIMMSFSS